METDANEATDGPFDDALTPAVRAVPDDGTAEGGVAGPVPGDVTELTGPRRTLDPGIQVVWVLKGVVPSLVLGGIVGVAFAVLPVGGPWVGAAVALVAFVLSAVLSVLRYRSWAYEVREDSLYLERGVITHVQTVAPYVRIQHVDASRGPIERAFGLASTVVYTAGSRGADVSIPGLSPADAEDLQARLKRLAIAAEGEDAV
jgi:membrane protein YdbS with pleckstrin-like domain